MTTWKAEMLVVGGVLALVVALTGNALRAAEWIGAGAVLLSFGHAQVGDRLAEREAQRAPSVSSVHCYRWNGRYLVGKECLWLTYFVIHGSWSALAGVGLFLAYPIWRRYYRDHVPLRGASASDEHPTFPWTP